MKAIDEIIEDVQQSQVDAGGRFMRRKEIMEMPFGELLSLLIPNNVHFLIEHCPEDFTPTGCRGIEKTLNGEGDFDVRTRVGITVDWNEAPYWAKYHAVDECGDGYWFELKPQVEITKVWFETSVHGRLKFNISYDLTETDWKTTLTKRP